MTDGDDVHLDQEASSFWVAALATDRPAVVAALEDSAVEVDSAQVVEVPAGDGNLLTEGRKLMIQPIALNL